MVRGLADRPTTLVYEIGANSGIHLQKGKKIDQESGVSIIGSLHMSIYGNK